MSEKRLEKVMQALNGKERALLFLREYKDGTNTEPGGVGVAFLTAREHREYARLISLIRLCNNELADIVFMVKEQVTQEELRFNAMQLMIIAADNLWILGKYVKECVPKPVTAAEAKARKAPKCGFDVRAAEEVTVSQENRDLALQFTKRGFRLKRPFTVPEVVPDKPKPGIETIKMIARVVRDNLASCWMQLRAVDEMAARYAEEFQGQDPLRPQFREHLDTALRRCEVLRDELVEYIGEWELPDDLLEAPAMLEKLADRVLR